nr:MAG TPA: hypothetical protein [Podoviridae sp. ctgHy19]
MGESDFFCVSPWSNIQAREGALQDGPPFL